jgi:3-oxoacyl-[acyl-carrier protein] reductase
MELTGKIALITGGGTGLGREIALRLAHEGMTLALSYSRSQVEAEQTAAEIEATGGHAAIFQADLARTADAIALVQQVGQAFGRLDLLIHNAATTRFVPFPDLDAIDEAAWDEIFAVNTRAAFFLAQAAAPLLREAGNGQIITTSSIAGIRAGGSSLPYAVSKAALIHLTKCLAVALAPHVRVNSVAPGLLLTRWAEGFGEERLAEISQKALLKKPVDLGDTADVFVMLAKNSSITGQVIAVDAGLMDA